eukprot:6850839-Alexandrium_andersonii.AAC.1
MCIRDSNSIKLGIELALNFVGVAQGQFRRLLNINLSFGALSNCLERCVHGAHPLGLLPS